MILTSRKVKIFLGRQGNFFVAFTLLLLGAFATQAAAASDKLLHNSNNLGPKYGTWGVAGGTYGEFICTTCHRTTTDNVKRVFGSIPATIGPNVVKTVIFNNMTGFGDDSTSHATSVRICEVCHTQTTAHQYNTANAPQSGNLDHANGDCMACHPHSDGFKASGHNVPLWGTAAGHTGCASGIGCHLNSNPAAPYPTSGDPVPAPDCRACHTKADPTVSTNGCGSCHGVANGDGEPSGTVHPDAAGSHPVHTPLASCTECHNTGGTGGNANHGKGNRGANPEVVNLAAFYTWNGTTCSTSYCHSSGQSTTGGATPVYAPSPNWGNTGTTCGSCHLNFDSNASATGDHVKHAQTNSISCATCHSGYTETTVAAATHVNNIIELSFSGTAATGTVYSQGNGPVGNNYGNCTISYCHSTGQSSTGGASPTYPATPPTWGSTVTNCGSCHLNFDSNPAATGDHYKHAQGTTNFSCSTCHNGYTETTVASATHINKTIEISFSGTNASGTTYSQGNGAVGLGYGNCSTSKCHGSGAPVWGGALYSAAVICENCHGSASSNPFYSTAATGAVPTKITAETDSKVGAHLAHLTARAGYTSAVTCGDCHAVPGSLTAAGHMNGSATPAFSGDAVLNSASPTYAASICSNTYCHGAKMIGSSNNGIDTSPTWTNTAYLTGTPAKTGDCAMCHGCPPNTTDHGTETLAECNGCHSHVNTNGTFTAGTNRTLHINGIVESSTNCISCHNKTQTGTHGTPRGNVVGEFTLAWGHKKSGRGAVTDADCIVCHLEGEFNTQKTSATYHKDGNIDLRDPDGANGEIRITNIANASFTFTRFATSYAAGSRTSTGHTANNVDNIITQKFCLKCHDAGGATNTTARAGSSPTATAPFGGGFTAQNTAAQFATTNSSKHPVLGPLTKDYPTAAKLSDPYKPTGTRGTSGTKTAGIVMNCFDCHNAPTTPLTTRTVVAHGNANTIRGANSTAEGTTSTFCNTCHLSYSAANQESHGAGSAFNGNTNGNMDTWIMACNVCHASALAPGRPAQSESAHGVNTLPSTGATKTLRWLAGGTQGVPISFIRNTTYLTNHQPLKIGTTNYSPQCSMTGSCGSRPARAYSPGGTY